MKGSVLEDTAAPMEALAAHVNPSESERKEEWPQLEKIIRDNGPEAEASAERYRILMQNAGEAILVVDRRGLIAEVNTRAANLLGLPASTILGTVLDSFLPPAESARFPNGLAHTLLEGKLDATEYIKLNAGGRAAICEVTASRIQVGTDELALMILRDVTERREADRQLRARERQLAEAQHIAGVGSWDLDLLTGALDASEEMLRIFGVDRPALGHLAIEDFLYGVHPDDVARLRQAVDAAREGSANFEVEYPMRRGGGDTVVIHARAATVRDATGAAVRMIGTAQDITERKDAEARLEESEQRYRSLFQYNHDACFSLDLEGRFTSVNPACSTLSGFAPASLLGGMFHSLIVPEHLDLAQGYFDAACRGRSHTYQLAITHRKGHRLEVGMTNTPIRVGGELVGVFGIATDITERVRAQEALRLSEETLRTVVDASPVGIVQLTPDGSVVTWSAAAQSMFGWTTDEVRHTPSPFASEESGEELRLLRGRVLKGESLLGVELVRLRKDGSEFPVSLSVSPVRAADGTITGMVAAVLDLSARKAAERALHESGEQLQHAQKMEAVGRLAGGIAHDFNNALTAIKGSVQMLLLDAHGDDPSREDLVDIDHAVDRAADLTRRLLTFSRRGLVEPRVLDLSAVVVSTERLLRQTVREDIILTVVPGDTPLCIHADAGQLEQVLMNLVVNAVDAMPQGGRLEVETQAVNMGGPDGPEDPDLATGPYVQLRVTDTGCGMSPGVQQCAFDPFFSTKQGQGTGLGLSTVYGIVQQSGGVIRVQSEVGVGTTFRMLFPRMREQDTCVRSRVPGRGRTAGTETLLLVEDEPYVRKIVCRALERNGQRVLLASSGEEALEVFARHDEVVDLLITDVVMPGMSGADLAGRIRAQQPGVRVLFMSGYTDEVISRHGVLDPGIDFIQKPFSPATLVARVREVINGAAHG